MTRGILHATSFVHHMTYGRWRGMPAWHDAQKLWCIKSFLHFLRIWDFLFDPTPILYTLISWLMRIRTQSCIWLLGTYLFQIPIALDMAKDFKGKEDSDLFRKITSDDYMRSAVVECYQTLKELLFGLLIDERDTM